MFDVLIDALQAAKERSQENALDWQQDALVEAYEYAEGRLYVGLAAYERGDAKQGMKNFRRAERRLAQAVGR